MDPKGFDPSQEMKRNTMEIHYYLDEDRPQVAFHAHPFYEIYYFLEGPLERYVVGGNSYRLRPGDILLMPPGVAHHPIFDEGQKPYRRYVLWLSEEQLAQMEQLDPGLTQVLRRCREQEAYRIRCSTPAAGKSLESYLQSMWQEEQSASSCKYACLYSLCLNFLVLLNRVIADDYIYHPRNTKPNSLMDQVLAYIHDNYTKAITLTDVADHFLSLIHI